MEDSTNNINGLVKAFMQRSKADFHSANSLLKSGDYADAAYHAQQSAEKIIKCVLILNNQFVRTHIVSGVFAEVISKYENKQWKIKLQDLIPILVNLEKHWILPRYPEPYGEGIWNPLEEYTKDIAENAVEKAGFIINTITQFIKEVYEIEVK